MLSSFSSFSFDHDKFFDFFFKKNTVGNLYDYFECFMILNRVGKKKTSNNNYNYNNHDEIKDMECII